MPPSGPPADDRSSPAARVRARLVDLDRGWWATLLGLAAVTLAEVLP